MLDIDRLTKQYDAPAQRVLAVDDLSLQARAGEFVAVQGPSGCGKSTLLLAAGGLLHPDSGSVRVADTDLYKLGNDERARFRAQHIGFVFQQFHLIPYLSVLDNVLASTLPVPRDARQEAVALLGKLGMSGRLAHVPAELSTGERQRTALARALLNQPKLVLADEPTGNLDPDNAAIVLGHLRDFAHAGGTVLLVTHDPQAAAQATRIIKLDKGKIVE
ncbi:MAG: ABC transporter ATP-binding protein [Gemmataceae bacterium]